MQNDNFKKKCFDLSTQLQGSMVYLRQYICYPVNVCVFPFNFNMQNDRIMKKLNFGLGTTSKAVSEYDQEIPQ